MEEKKTQSTYKRSLTNAHIQLIALGGTIGTGLFLGVGNSIQKAGPAVILIYIIVGLFLFILMRALGELILSDLKKHTYIEFIEKYLGKDIGKVTGYLYWLSWLILAMAETTALGIYFKSWLPNLPTWLPGVLSVAVLLLINLISARFFGNLEFAFAIIKILMIVGFVIFAAFMLLSSGSTKYGQASFSNLYADGFFNNGASGFLQGFQMVIFSFIGVELIGLTASEAKDPHKTIRSAINELPLRIILFYVLAIIGILVILPWNKVSISSSPFVQALMGAGFKGAGNLINFVVITAAISATNSFLYSAGRLLFSVTLGGESKWSKFFGQLNHRQLPMRGLVFSALIIICAPLITLIMGDEAFSFISSMATSMFLLIWIIMTLTHLRYRQVTPKDQLHEFQLPAYPFLDYLLLAFFGAMVILLLFLESYRVPMITALITFAVLYGFSKALNKKKEAAK